MTRKLVFPCSSVKALSAFFALVAAFLCVAPAHATNSTPSTTIIISQVYGGGGNSGASLNTDFVELYNTTNAAIDISGYSIQYGSGTGATIASTSLFPTGASIPAHGYYLMAGDAVANGGTGICYAADALAGFTSTTAGSANMQIAAAGGKIYLVNNTTALSSTSLPNATGGALPAGVVDMVGTGTANAFEGAVGPTMTTTMSAQRNNPPNYANTGNNHDDFSLVTVLGNTHTSGGPNVISTCPIPTSSAAPASVAQGGTTTLSVSIAAGAPTGPGGAAAAPTALTITADLTAFGGSATAAFTPPGTIAATTANVYTLSLSVPSSQTVNSAYSIPVTITDKGGDTISSTIALAVTGSGGGGSTAPTATASFSPTSVAQGGSSTLTVTVTPNSGTGIAVKANLSSLGGSAAQTLTASGNTWTYTENVSGSQAATTYTIPITVTDTQSDSITVTSPTLTVTSSSVGTTTAVVANPTAPTPNQSTTLTATVTATSGTTAPTGTVTFTDNTSTTLCTANIALAAATSTTSTATCTVSAGFSATTHSIVATYTHSGSFSDSTSSPLVLNVTAITFGSGIVITQMYGAGGNTNAVINADYLELFNDSATPKTMNGWSVQYASAAGTSVTAGTAVYPLPTVTIPAGGYYLVGGATGGTGVPTTATFDSVPLNAAVPPVGFGFAAGAGKVYLVSSTTPLASTAIPLDSSVVDAITYGTSLTNPQGTGGVGAPTPSTTLVDVRTNPCVDTNNDASDFSAVTVTAGTAHNSASAINPCGNIPLTTNGGTVTPSTAKVGTNALLTVNVSPGGDPASTGISVTANLSAFGLGTVSLNDAGTNGDVTANDHIYSYSIAIPNSQAATSYNITIHATDTQGDTVPDIIVPLTVSALTPTSVNLSAVPAAPVPNQSTVLTATITPNPGAGDTVIFKDNGTAIGTTGTVNSSGVATTTISGGFAAGTHPLTAVYSGDSTYATSTGSLSLSVVAPTPPEFSLGLSNIQLIASGPAPSATTNVNITAVGGLSAVISFKCDGAPADATCSFSPATVQPNTGANGAFVSTVMTLRIDTSSNAKPNLFHKTSGSVLAFILLAVPFAVRRRKSLLGAVALAILLLAGSQALTGCGNGGTPPSSGTITVTATATTGQQHSATLTFTTQ